MTIEPGMHHGDLVRYPGQGELEIDGDNGDLIVGIHLLEHKTFHRKQNDLYSNVTISLKVKFTNLNTSSFLICSTRTLYLASRRKSFI